MLVKGEKIMSEICLDCFNKMLGTNYTEKDYRLSKETMLCEDCEEMKRIFVKQRRFSVFPFKNFKIEDIF